MKRNNRCRKRKRTEKKKKKNNTLYLPHELIIQILLRLPVKSLIRFKCVCKSWFSLISHDPHFTNSHFEITAATSARRILLTNLFPDFEPISIDFEPSIHDDNASPDLHYLFPDSYFGLQIKGSCRGFILFHTHSNFYLWNPSTGFPTKIPFSPFASEEEEDEEGDKKFYGFGYDHSTDDYLVVSISVHPLHFEFFSLRANTWKQIEYSHLPFNAIYGNHKAGLLFNEAIHWLAYRHESHKAVVVVFDLIERKLFYMDLPCDSYMCCDLWVFEEFLGFSVTNFTNDTVEIWAMKEYKVDTSWTKTHVVSVDGTPNESFSPLCCTKNGDIIGTDHDTGLVRYNDKGQLLEHRPYSSEFEAVVYTESLLSLPGESEQA